MLKHSGYVSQKFRPNLIRTGIARNEMVHKSKSPRYCEKYNINYMGLNKSCYCTIRSVLLTLAIGRHNYVWLHIWQQIYKL